MLYVILCYITNECHLKGMARNYDEAGMPSMFKSFNGKPCLVRDKKIKGEA